MRAPTIVSPFNLFQERFRRDPWRLLVCVQLLNQTSGRQLEDVVGPLFERWPTEHLMSTADPDEVARAIRTLGLQNRRARTLVALSKAVADDVWATVDELPGCGKYAADSYKIFVRGELPGVDDVEDKELKRYIRWATGLETTRAP